MGAFQLDEGASVTLTGAPGAGRGSLRIGPQTPRTRWQVTSIGVTGTSALDTECRVYVGPEAPSNFLVGTYSGNRDTTEAAVVLYPGQFLTVTWVNGTVGATQSVSLFGTYDVAR